MNEDRITRIKPPDNAYSNLVTIEKERDAYYKAEDGISIFPCRLQQAQLWLRGGFFTSDSPFSLRRPDGEDGEWTTLVKLMEQNGRAMPFHDCFSSEEEKKEHEEELGRLQEEMDALRQRKELLLRVLCEIRERATNVRKELNQLVKKVESPSIVHSPITWGLSGHPSGVASDVDPFALLKSCEGARRKLEGDVVAHFQRLITIYKNCKKDMFMKQTIAVFRDRESKVCALCRGVVVTLNQFIWHICGRKHFEALQGVVCADAFDFWWNAVKKAAGLAGSVHSNQMNLPGFPKRISEKADNNTLENDQKTMEFKSLVDPPISPSLGADPFALLKSCNNAKRKLGGDISCRLGHLRTRFDKCVKSVLCDLTKDLFSKRGMTKCQPCGISIACHSACNLIHHVCGRKHIQAMEGVVCADAFDFWREAVEKATKNPIPSLLKLSIPKPCTNPKEDLVKEQGTSVKCDKKKPEDDQKTVENEKKLHEPRIEVNQVTNPNEELVKEQGISEVDQKTVENERKLHEPVTIKKKSYPVTRLFPMLFLPPGVHPFDLLEPCEGARRKLGGDVSARMHQLRDAMEECDKKKLVKLMTESFGEYTAQKCELCDLVIEQPGCLVPHFCSPKHIGKMQGAVCADAFDFWMKTLEDAKENEKVVYPRIVPPPDVDPFAVLKSGRNVKKLEGDIADNFKQLRARYKRCDKNELVQRTSDIFLKFPSACRVCNSIFLPHSATNLIEHFLGHVNKIKNGVCADAFKFWWNAVEDTTRADQRLPPYQLEPAPRGVSRAHKFWWDAVEGPTRVVPRLPPPRVRKKAGPVVPMDHSSELGQRLTAGTAQSVKDSFPLAVLKSVQAVEEPCANPKIELTKLRNLFNVCDKNKLDNDPKTMILFRKPRSCLICSGGYTTNSASNLLSHITGNDHLTELTSMKGAVSWRAIGFWINAVKRAST